MRVIVRFDTPLADNRHGLTRRQRNLAYERPDMNRSIDIPMGAEYLMDWFWSISASRGCSHAGPEPISPAMIKAWSEYSGDIVNRDEAAVIVAMDIAYRDAVARENEPKKG